MVQCVQATEVPRHCAKWAQGHCRKLKILMITPRLGGFDENCFKEGRCQLMPAATQLWRKKYLQRDEKRGPGPRPVAAAVSGW